MSFEAASAYSPLTSRQQEVSELVALGLTDAEIAKSLQLSRATVKGHITVVLRRLNLRDRTQLALYIHRAARSGMVSTAEPSELPMEVVDRVVEMVDRFEERKHRTREQQAEAVG